VAEDLVIVLEPDAEHGVGQKLNDLAAHFKEFFFGQKYASRVSASKSGGAFTLLRAKREGGRQAAASTVPRWGPRGSKSSAEQCMNLVDSLPQQQWRRTMSQRELIEPHKGDKRYVRRDENGRFSESDDVSRSLSADARQHAKHAKPRNQGDRGD
jgi:hypothetical protein